MTAAGRSRSHLLIVVLALSGLLLLTLVLAPMLLTTFTLPFGGLGFGADCAEAAADREDVSRSARDDIPEDYLRLYKEHGARVGVQWNVLAAIGKRETDHGRSTLPGVRSGTNYAGRRRPDAVPHQHLGRQAADRRAVGDGQRVRVGRGRRRHRRRVQPGRRDPRRGAHAQAQRRPRRPAAGDLRLQPRHLVRRPGARDRPAVRGLRRRGDPAGVEPDVRPGVPGRGGEPARGEDPRVRARPARQAVPVGAPPGRTRSTAPASSTWPTGTPG